MLQRIVTGVVSAALLIALMLVRGLVFDIVIALLALFGCYEMLGAFARGGLKPPRVPVYGMAALMLPAYLLLGPASIYLTACSATLFVAFVIALRKEPRWADAVAALNVLVSVPIPMMMFYPIIRIRPEALGALLAFSVFLIALLGDTFAYFVGVAVGTHQMTPVLSPKKTWEGAAAGLLGSFAAAMLVFLYGETVTAMPPFWHFAVLGVVGGLAAQLGDLTASLIKRFCGIKDYGTLFPGHGGMMDRFDSIIFVTYAVFGYCMSRGVL